MYIDEVKNLIKIHDIAKSQTHKYLLNSFYRDGKLENLWKSIKQYEYLTDSK